MQQSSQPKTNDVLKAKACAFICERLGKFASVIKHYENEENDKHYDIEAKLEDGFRFFIIVRVAEGVLPIDLEVLNRIKNANDDKNSETSLAVVWNSQNPSPDSCVFFTNAKLSKIFKEGKA